MAFVAGIAAMLAFETRASSGVGVAISVTTIPAAAYLGVAAGLGEATKALGALAVLATNVVMIVAGAAITLGLQRRMAHSRSPHRTSQRSAMEEDGAPRIPPAEMATTSYRRQRRCVLRLEAQP